MTDQPIPRRPIDAVYERAMGHDRVASIQAGTCGSCGGPATAFKDELSAREYRISGLCQTCQDPVFMPDPFECLGFAWELLGIEEGDAASLDLLTKEEVVKELGLLLPRLQVLPEAQHRGIMRGILEELIDDITKLVGDPNDHQ